MAIELLEEEAKLRERLVQVHDDRSWSPSEGDGICATLLPVQDADGTLIDILAWRAEFPRLWWRRTSRGVVLGADELHRCQWRERTRRIRLVGTPALWCAASLPSVCILDWKTDLRSLLGAVEEIECHSHGLAQMLHRELAAQVRHRYTIEVAGRR